MNTRVPAVCQKLYAAAGTLLIIGMLIYLMTEIAPSWMGIAMGVLIWLAITTGALLAGYGALVQDRIENPRHRE